MATIGAVLNGIVKALRPKFTGLTVGGIPVSVAIAEDWPSEEAIQKVAKQPKVVMAVVDRFGGQDPKYAPRRLGIEKMPIGIKSTLNETYLAPGGTVTVTIALADNQVAVQDKDAVSLVLRHGGTTKGAVGVAVAGNSLSNVAAALASDINAALSDWVSATSSGAVVTVTNTSSNTLRCESYTGNTGILYRELGRANAQIQIAFWCGEFAIRRAVSDILEVECTRFRAQRGIVLPTQERIRVTASNRFTVPNDKDTPADLYRRDFTLDVHYSVTSTDLVYAVLVPISPISSFPE